jgi:hypothetical protein
VPAHATNELTAEPSIRDRSTPPLTLANRDRVPAWLPLAGLALTMALGGLRLLNPVLPEPAPIARRHRYPSGRDGRGPGRSGGQAAVNKRTRPCG